MNFKISGHLHHRNFVASLCSPCPFFPHPKTHSQNPNPKITIALNKMSSLFRFQSAARRLSFHRLRSFSLAANNQESETLEPFDQRKLPTDYDPSNFDPSNHRPPPTPRVWNLVDEVSSFTLSEIADLCQILVKKCDLKEPPTVAIMGAGAGAGGTVAGKGGAEKAGKEEAKKEEKTVFELKLEGFEAANKIKVIKEVRGFTDLGLKEAKEMVEKAPVVIKGGVSKEDGLAIIEKMKAVGAKVVLE